MSDVLIQSKKVHPNNLPILAYKTQLLYGLEISNTLIVMAETGSGKTTQIPQYLVEAGYAADGRILISLPRKMAAISIAQRVSDENGTEIGDDIGYRVRFVSKVTEQTKVEYVTDGTLVQIIMGNPLIEGYSVIMLDDIHERTLNTDLLLCLVKKIQTRRPELKVIISSATLQVEELSRYFTNAQILYVKGRNYNVDIYYQLQPCKNYVIAAVELTIQVHKEMGEGDILVFLTSAEEIHAFQQMMALYKSKLVVLPLFANLSIEKQLDVFKQQSHRKVIAATNIAESSVTIDGIVTVIDCCQQKVKVYDHSRNLEQLIVVPISQQQAQQRSGRAGRTRNGQCYRLCTKEDFDQLPSVFPPEILRSNLTDLILQIRSFSLNPNHLQCPLTFLTPAPLDLLVHPVNTLLSLKLFENDLTLTDLGSLVVDYPVDFRLGVCIESSFAEEFQCSEEMIKIASILSVQGGVFHSDVNPLSILKAKKALGCKEGDVLSLHNIFVRYMSIGNKGGWCDQHKISKNKLESAAKIYRQLQLRRKGRPIRSSISDVEAILRCLLTGYFQQVAQKQVGFQDQVYRNVFTKQLVHLHPGSVLTISHPEWVIYYELVEHQNKLVMNQVTEIDPFWLFEIAPHFFKDSRKDQAEQKHQVEKEQLEIIEKEKIQQDQQKALDQESKVMFGSVRSIRKPGFQGFHKPNFPIKAKDERIGSVKQGSLSFDDDDI